MNRLESANVWFFCAVMAAVVTTGARLAAMLTLNGDQLAVSAALQFTPSNARISSASPVLPVTKLVWASCAAVISITVPAACATPFTTKWPLAGSAVVSRI